MCPVFFCADFWDRGCEGGRRETELVVGVEIVNGGRIWMSGEGFVNGGRIWVRR